MPEQSQPAVSSPYGKARFKNDDHDVFVDQTFARWRQERVEAIRRRMRKGSR